MKDLRQITNGMWSRKNALLPDVWIHDVDDKQQSNTFKLILVYDGKDEITEDFMSTIYAAYYQALVKNGVDFDDPSYDDHYVSIKSLYVTCGIGLSYVSQNDILSPTANILQSFVRHYYTVPTPISLIPKAIRDGAFTLPNPSVEFINSRIITSLLAQEKTPGKIKIHFNMVKKGILDINVPNLGDCKIQYELPDHSLSIRTNPNNFRVEGHIMSTDNRPILLTPDPSKKEWFNNNDNSVGGIEISNIIKSELAKRLKLNKLQLSVVGITRNAFKYTNGE
jgi:hypothetical protein